MRVLLFTISIALLALGACKPQISLTGASIPIEAKTVSVGFFTNNTTLGAPSLSQRFTEKLRDVVSQQTRLALVKNNGDMQFDGYIADYKVTPVAIQSTDQAAQNRLSITINVVFMNKFDPSKNFEQAFTRYADFSSADNIAAVEPALVQEIYRQITEDIFNKAFNNW